MKKEIVNVKKNGKLIALGEKWSYWRYDGSIYAIAVEGDNMCFWCSEARLGEHLHRLYQIHGHTFFTERSEIVIVDKEYLSQFTYA